MSTGGYFGEKFFLWEKVGGGVIWCGRVCICSMVLLGLGLVLGVCICRRLCWVLGVL